MWSNSGELCGSGRKPEKLLPIKICQTPDVRMERLLQKSGWREGFKLPFANEENKALEKKLEAKQRRAIDLSGSLDDDEEHVKKLKNHHMQLEYDYLITQSLITAKLGELKSDQKNESYVEQVLCKKKADKCSDVQKLVEVRQRVHAKLNEVKRRSEVVKDLMNISKFNELAMKKWKEHTVDTGQDILYSKFFTKTDEKIQAFYEKKEVDLTLTNKEQSDYLGKLAQETVRLQDLFGRTKRDFVRAHNERQETINSWTNAVKSLKRKELDMEVLGNDYCIARQHLLQLNCKIWEKENVLQAEHQSRKQAEYEITKSERKSHELTAKLREVQRSFSRLCAEHTNFQMQLHSATEELNSLHKSIKGHAENQENLAQRTAKVEAELIVLQSKMEIISGHMGDSQEILNQMHMMLQEHEDTCERAGDEIKRFRQFHFERSNERAEVETEYKFVLKKIETSRTTIGFNIIIGQREEIALQRMTTELFHIDLTSNQLITRITNITNEYASTSYILNQAKLQRLKRDLEEIGAEKWLLHREISHDESIKVRMKREIVAWEEKERKREHILAELQIICPAIEKELNETSEELKSIQVSTQLEKVLLKRLEDEIAANNDQICDLTQYRYLLEGAVKDRKIEIDTHIDMQLVAIKTTNEQIEKLKGYINEVLHHLGKQKRKFGCISTLLAIDPADASGRSSFTSTVLRVIEERELLSREKQSWEAKVLEAELELKGLETNVSLMETSNCQFKTCLYPLPETAVEVEKVKKAEALIAAAELRKKRSNQIKLKCKDFIDDLQNANHVIKNHLTKMSIQYDHKARLVSKLTNSIILQRERISRWANICMKQHQEIKGSLPLSQLLTIQQNLKLKCLQEKLEFAVLMLEKLILVFPDAKDLVMDYLMLDSDTHELCARVSQTVMKYQGHDVPLHRHGHLPTESFVNFVQELYGEVPTARREGLD